MLNSCQGEQLASEKTQAMMDNMKAYADIGGRMFTSHYGNIWIGGETGVPTHAPAVWKDIASFGDSLNDAPTDTIDQVNNPKGASFATWMQNVGGSTSNGQVAIESGSFRQTVNTLRQHEGRAVAVLGHGRAQYPQNFQFTTPNEMPANARCGKVVFSDMHVGGDQFRRAPSRPDARAAH